MKHRRVTINNKHIDVYDDLFTFEEVSRMFIRVRQYAYAATNFSDGFRSHIYGEKHKLKYVFQSREECMEFGYLQKLYEVNPDFGNSYIVHRQYVNLATLSDFDTVHIDDNHLSAPRTALYYPHPDWNIHWGGHTHFFDDALEHIEFTAAYRPGRLVLFDGRIPHCGTPPNTAAQDKRYVVTSKFQLMRE